MRSSSDDHRAGVTAEPMDLDDFRELLGGGRLEQAAAGVAVQLQERRHGQPNGGGVDAGVVALDDSGLLEPADPGRDRRRRQVHPLGDLVERKPCVVLDLADDGPVGPIQFGTHDGDGIRSEALRMERGPLACVWFAMVGRLPIWLASWQTTRRGDAVDFKLELVVKVTPPGSACSIGFGSGVTVDSGPLVTAPPGSQRGLHLAVADLTAARDELIARGIDVGEIRHVQDGRWYAGLDPNRRSYMSFAEFSDPDGNLWLLQEIRRDHEGAE
jgi:hypothetical protein